MKHLPFPGWGRKGESLPWTGNFVPGAGGLRREQKVPAWKAGTLPTELPPPPTKSFHFSVNHVHMADSLGGEPFYGRLKSSSWRCL